jgi:hypothetical protein
MKLARSLLASRIFAPALVCSSLTSFTPSETHIIVTPQYAHIPKRHTLV